MSTPTAAGNDRAPRRNHAADGRAHAPMHVRHGGDPLVDERQLRDVQELLARGVFERDALGPGLDRHAVVGLDYVVCVVCHLDLSFGRLSSTAICFC